MDPVRQNLCTTSVHNTIQTAVLIISPLTSSVQITVTAQILSIGGKGGNSSRSKLQRMHTGESFPRL